MRQHKLFGFIINSIYRWDGAIKEDYNGRTREYGFEVPQEVLVYSDTNNLISLDENGNKITLTDKGRYFVKRFTEEN